MKQLENTIFHSVFMLYDFDGKGRQNLRMIYDNLELDELILKDFMHL